MFKYWWLIITLFIVTYLWTRDKFLAYHQPTNLVLDIYYVTSMAIYALAVIFLIYLICVAKKSLSMGEDSKNNPFLAFYAYRAFLANFFWDQILWQQLNFKEITEKSLILGLLLIWIFTWILSYLWSI